MADTRGWPDPANPGVPVNPDQPGPHLIVDEYGQRRWGWWRYGGCSFQDNMTGIATQAAIMAGKKWTYAGPAVPPDGKPVP
jgi:hypothetical protein